MRTRASTTADTWLRFVLTIAGEDARQQEIATRTGITQATVSRWLAGERGPSAESVIMFARGYGVNPVTALVAAGLITSTEADLPRKAIPTLDGVPTKRLIRELARRDRDSIAAEAAS